MSATEDNFVATPTSSIRSQEDILAGLIWDSMRQVKLINAMNYPSYSGLDNCRKEKMKKIVLMISTPLPLEELEEGIDILTNNG